MPKDWIPEEPMEAAQLPFLDAKGEPAAAPAEPPPPPIRVSLFAVLLPRFPEHELTGELSDRLRVWTMRLCLAWDWTAERIDVRPDRLEITLVLPPEESPAHAIQELRDGLSERVLRAFPELLTDLPSHRFWASSYLLRAGPPPPAQDVDVFIQATRRAQTGPLRP
jgi:REP element-mobilizing transposase RayT